jgi:hypothetical protein
MYVRLMSCLPCWNSFGSHHFIIIYYYFFIILKSWCPLVFSIPTLIVSCNQQISCHQPQQKENVIWEIKCNKREEDCVPILHVKLPGDTTFIQWWYCVDDVFIVIKLDLVEIKFHFKLDFFIKMILFYFKKTKKVINTNIKYIFSRKCKMFLKNIFFNINISKLYKNT